MSRPGLASQNTCPLELCAVFQVLLAACTCAVHGNSCSSPREGASPSARSAPPAHAAERGFWTLIQAMTAPSITYRLSGTVILYNKYILAYYGFPFPIALTMWHMTFSGVLAFILVRLGYVGVSPRACCARSCHVVLSLQAGWYQSHHLSNTLCNLSSSVACESHLLPLPVHGTPDSCLSWHPLPGRLPPLQTQAGWAGCRHVT